MHSGSRLSVVDLFSGAGGMSAGFAVHPASYRLVGAADLEVGKKGVRTYCNETYEANFGVRPENVDLAAVAPTALMDAMGLSRGDLDVLISCAPCTGFSQKNAANHVVDDPRNALVPRSVEFVRAFEPEFFVMENVEELVGGRQSHHFDRLRRGLERLGYAVTWSVHNLNDFGVPQNRIRALVLARRDGGVISQPMPSGPRPTVRDAIAHLAPLEAGETDPEDPMHSCPGFRDHSLARIQAVPKDGGSWTDIPAEKAHLLIPSMRRPNRRNGSFPDIYGRMWWDRPAPTITRECAHPGNGRYLHPQQDRLLTVREMALLQGFPENFEFCGPLYTKYCQIGDAVPPSFAAQVAAHLEKVLRGQVVSVLA